MRVTNSIQNRMYLKNTNANLENMLNSMNRMITNKAYTRVSQDSINASKAMTTRRQLSNLAMYEDNLNTAYELFTSAEVNLYEINNKYVNNILPKMEQAVNSTYSAEERASIGLELDEIANHFLSIMNSDFAERQMFGGTSNGATPFTAEVDANGRTVVYYNGDPVDSYDDPKSFNGSNPIFVDIGLGIKYDDDYNVDPQTAMDISLNGAEMTGCGVDAQGYSKNMIQLLFDTAAACRDNDPDKINALIDKVTAANGTVLSAITVLGSKYSSVEFYLDKNDDYEYSLLERQNDVEGVDFNEEISKYESLDASYQAALKLSSKVLPRSIFDFV